MTAIICDKLYKRNRASALRMLILAVAMLCGLVVSAATPAEQLRDAAARLNSAKSIRAEFSISGAGGKATGTLLSKGRKFSIVSPLTSTWYDGSAITVYNPSTREATIWTPSPSELAESNPLLYLSTAANYNVAAGTGGAKGERVLLLTPKKRGGSVKSIRIVLNAVDMLPKSMRITAAGGTTDITIRNLRLNAAVADSSFIFPRKSYPKAVVTDLR